MTEYQIKVLDALESISAYMKALKERTKPCPPIRDKATNDMLSYERKTLPVGHKIPETTNEAIERIMYQSGAITREQWERLKGYSYDTEGEDDEHYDEEYEDDEFVQSAHASYDDIEMPFIEESKQIKATAVEEKQSQEASADASVADASVEPGAKTD